MQTKLNYRSVIGVITLMIGISIGDPSSLAGAISEVLVAIASESQSKYGRSIDVLNALAATKIDNVTFTVDEEE